MSKFLIAMISILPLNAYADGSFSALEGQYALTGSYTSDVGNSHFRVLLTGKTAQDLYSAMEGQIVIDDCTNAKSKTVGQMQCFFYEESKTYECDFSIDLVEQTITHGLPC